MANVETRTKMNPRLIKWFADAVRSMRGNRTAKEYANAAGVSQSMISKYENQQITSSCSLETLVKLHSAKDPECGITLEELKAMVGIEPSNLEIPTEELYGFSYVEEAIRKEYKDALIKRSQVKPGNIEHDKDITVTLPDNKVWYISNDVSMYAREKGRDFLDNYLLAFAKCIRAAEFDTEGARYSILLNSQEQYEEFSKLLSSMRLKSCASVIFVRYNIYDGITWIEESTCLDKDGNRFEGYINT